MATLTIILCVFSTPAPVHEAMIFRGIPPSHVVAPWTLSPSEHENIAGLAFSANTPEDLADELYRIFLQALDDGRLRADAVNEPKARPPKTASEVLRLIFNAKALGNRDVGCLELSFAFLAAARSLGLDAFGVERPKPLGTGQIGHVMVGVRFAPAHVIMVYDLQNRQRGSHLHHRELHDAQFVAHHYNHLAVSAFLQGNAPAALKWIDWGLLLHDSPPLLANRAVVLAHGGEHHLAAAEARWAVHKAPDVPVYRYALGHSLLATGALEEARAVLVGVVRDMPNYPLAWRDLGWTRLLLGDAAEEVLAALKRALVGAPSAPQAAIFLALAKIALGRGEELLGLLDDFVGDGLLSQDTAWVLRALVAGDEGRGDSADYTRLASLLQHVEKSRATRKRPN